MPSITTLVTFAGVVVVFAAIPGPSNLYVVGQAVRGGRRPGLLSALGCASGAAVYVVATSLGLAAVIASSATALSALHYLGGAYLAYLGLRALTGDSPRSAAAPEPRAGRTLRQGFIVELSNPKVVLFFLAFFPQFVVAGRGAAWSQILVLGAVFCALGLLSDSVYAVAAARLGRRLQAGRRGSAVSGVVYLGLAAWSFWSGARTRPA